MRRNAVAVIAGQTITAAAIDAGKLSYRPAAGNGALAYTSFQFQVQDDGGTVGGGQNTDASANTLTIDYNAAPHTAYTNIVDLIPGTDTRLYLSSDTAALNERYPTSTPIRLAFAGYLDDALGSETVHTRRPGCGILRAIGSTRSICAPA